MAYVIKSKKSGVRLPYIPLQSKIKNDRDVILDYYTDKDEAEVYAIMKHIINEEGTSYPQDEMNTVEDFRAYYLTHEAYVCRDVKTKEVLGAFYIKPNFPGRCSHICNGGFIVKVSARNQGVASFMARNYLQMARDLGYRASFFNLVFVNNSSSVRIWKKLGMVEIGRIPEAGNLKGIGYTDAIQFYYDLTQLNKTEGV